MLSGEVALSMGGQYPGHYTDRCTEYMKDSLEIPMGRDQQILIRRETIRNEAEQKHFGGNIIEERSFAIHLKNEKESAIGMEVIDQIPVSSNPDVVVKVIDLNGGQLQQANGKVSWTVRLEPEAIWFSPSATRCGILKIRSSIFHDEDPDHHDPCHEALESGLQEAGHELIDATTLSAKEIASQYPEAEGMLVRARIAFTQDFLENFPDLFFIARFGSGMEHIDVEWAKEENSLSQCG